MIKEISDDIENLINEREEVLLELHRSIFTSRYGFDKKTYSVLALHSIPIIYSLWEGFVYESCSLYLSFINSKKMNVFDLNNSLKVFYFESKHKQFESYPQKENKKVRFYDNLYSDFQNAFVEFSLVVDTESNVNFKVLNRILKEMCIEEFQEHWEQYTYPSPSLKSMLNGLVKYRNAVSHGGDVSSEEKVDIIVFEKYKDLVLNLMYEMSNRIIYSIENNNFSIIDR